MLLIKPSFEILEQKNLLEHIERCGRTAYRSEDKICPGSAKKFVDMLIKRGHGAVLEHGTVYLREYTDFLNQAYNNYHLKHRYSTNKYSIYVDKGIEHLVTTNYRVLIENGWIDDLKYLCEPTENHIKRHSVKFICDRGVSHKRFVA